MKQSRISWTSRTTKYSGRGEWLNYEVSRDEIETLNSKFPDIFHYVEYRSL